MPSAIELLTLEKARYRLQRLLLGRSNELLFRLARWIGVNKFDNVTLCFLQSVTSLLQARVNNREQCVRKSTLA